MYNIDKIKNQMEVYRLDKGLDVIITHDVVKCMFKLEDLAGDFYGNDINHNLGGDDSENFYNYVESLNADGKFDNYKKDNAYIIPFKELYTVIFGKEPVFTNLIVPDSGLIL